MSVELWLAFVAASAIMCVIPGPTVTLVVGYALAQGRGTALATALGVVLGDAVAMSLSLAGLGAILATSATLFTIVKVAGAAYLLYLGWKLWRSPVAAADGTPPPPASSLRMFGHAFAVTALNPKSIVFFVAFVPQFIDRGAAYAPQVLILVVTFVTIAFINVSTYAWLAARARGLLTRPSVLRWVNRIGGGILMGAGAAAVAIRGNP